MTYGNSLSTWQKAGILERELQLYKELETLGVATTIISYGTEEDLDLATKHPYIKVVCNKYRLHPRIYSLIIPALHARELKNANIYKTNQMYGAHIAVTCSKIYKKPLILRQGYGHYEHRIAEFGEDSIQARSARKYEERSFKFSSRNVFTTKQLADRAIRTHKLNKKNIEVIPNYIVPEIWTPPYRVSNPQSPARILFYGRFTEQKNLPSLIEAAENLPVHLILVGDGPLKESLLEKAERKNISAEFKDRMSQPELREALRSADFFILPSFYEGHPKSLLEAMAFGIPVIATRVDGIESCITHMQTGILSTTSPEGLRTAIKEAMNLKQSVSQAIADRAKTKTLEDLSVSVIAKKEFSVYHNMLSAEK